MFFSILLVVRLIHRRQLLHTGKIETLDLDKMVPRYCEFTNHPMVAPRLPSVKYNVVVIGVLYPNEFNGPFVW
jgi:hypothetical protein